MEVLIAVFIGTWISLSGVMAYRHIKKEYENGSTKDFIRGNEGK